jgi:transcriptional regulator with XRE-family HTH domain
MKNLPHIRLKELRKKRKYSQQYMADHLGISQMAYSKIESNKTQLNWDKLNRISKILEINIWDLIDDTKAIESEHPDNLSFNEALDMLKQLLQKHEDEKKILREEIKLLKKQLKK